MASDFNNLHRNSPRNRENRDSSRHTVDMVSLKDRLSDFDQRRNLLPCSHAYLLHIIAPDSAKWDWNLIQILQWRWTENVLVSVKKTQASLSHVSRVKQHQTAAEQGPTVHHPLVHKEGWHVMSSVLLEHALKNTPTLQPLTGHLHTLTDP